MFDSLLFEKGHFKALQFSLTQMIAAHFICIIKWHIATTFSFNENKQENVFPYKFLKIFKRPSFHCQIILDLKSL